MDHFISGSTGSPMPEKRSVMRCSSWALEKKTH